MIRMKKISLGLVFLFLGLMVAGAGSAETAKAKKKAAAKKAPEAVSKLPEKEPSKASEPDYPDPAVAEIHQELADIIRVHQSLQLQYRDQVREIQRITDQARAHQKLLKDLETIRHAQEAARTAKTLDDLVRLEKIRLIQEQTRQNRGRLEEIQKQES